MMLQKAGEMIDERSQAKGPTAEQLAESDSLKGEWEAFLEETERFKEEYY